MTKPDQMLLLQHSFLIELTHENSDTLYPHTLIIHNLTNWAIRTHPKQTLGDHFKTYMLSKLVDYVLHLLGPDEHEWVLPQVMADGVTTSHIGHDIISQLGYLYAIKGGDWETQRPVINPAMATHLLRQLARLMHITVGIEAVVRMRYVLIAKQALLSVSGPESYRKALGKIDNIYAAFDALPDELPDSLIECVDIAGKHLHDCAIKNGA